MSENVLRERVAATDADLPEAACTGEVPTGACRLPAPRGLVARLDG